MLQSGDTLLLEAHTDFVGQQRNSNDFYLVSHVENSTPPRHDRAWIALSILVGMILFATLLSRDNVPGGLPERDFLLPAALLARPFMIGTRCCTSSEAMQSIDWYGLIAIGDALGIGQARR